MAEPLRSVAYLGADKGRWAPAGWASVVEAAAGGLLDESHWVDLKQELPSGKPTINTDLAKDLASLAVDGGLLVIGIEDHNSHAGRVLGVDLAGLADRVDQIARDKIHPRLTVRSVEIPDPDGLGHGCLLVHIPPSPLAPHMVEHVYYGRGDRANIRLSDEQVRAILADRARTQRDVLTDLRLMIDDDPLPEDRRVNSHIYLYAQPAAGPDEIMVDFLGRGDAPQVINQALDQIRKARGGDGFEPDLRNLPNRIRRADGHAFTTLSHEYSVGENSAIDLLVREDGGLRLTCGRGTDVLGSQFHTDEAPSPVVFPAMLVGLTRSFVGLTGELADRHAAYQGQWHLAIHMNRLRGVRPWNDLHSGLGYPGHPYTRDQYERVTAATTDQLVTTPAAVADKLIAPLLRALGVAARHSPPSC
ncbi:hypothetical protein JOD54_004580 [Actinokineospora baliensis]|uniref:AlbA family DNA-binding domain-containing protein n=1 Tax=Actinokineospora baliensis TaxID=547056 RepID=UPI0019569A77|nr:ATP-binding protein [Actinokineospora baliensis]MBM7774376.1 hypothetical protein [Actinokineospora baliensis]